MINRWNLKSWIKFIAVYIIQDDNCTQFGGLAGFINGLIVENLFYGEIYVSLKRFQC